jgi:serine protease Do
MNTFKPWTAYAVLAGGALLGFATVVGINGGFRPASAMAQTRPALQTVGVTSGDNPVTLKALNDMGVNLADYVKPAVVHVKTVTQRSQDSEGKRIPISGSEGSGFVYRADGYIITNDHVVSGAKEVTIILNNGRELTGKVTSAPEWDVAVVKVDAKGLETLGMADSKQVKVGQMTVAIGSPFGLENSVTFGHVSALGRENMIPDYLKGGETRFYPDLIQTDAAINQGNSGGPLVDIDGRVIGMISSIASRNGGSNGIGFAIPSNQVRFLADQLIAKGKITRSMIGVVPRNLKPIESKELGIKAGALADDVSPGSPAEKAGIKKGDIIVAVQGEAIETQMDLRNSMLKNAPGTTVKIEYIRSGKKSVVDVRLEEFKKPSVPTAPSGSIDDLGDIFGGDGKMPNIDELQKRLKGSPDVQQDVEPLREGKARLGVSIENISEESRKQYKIPSTLQGVQISSIESGSVASKMGLQIGDVLVAIGDKKITSINDVTSAMEGVRVGDKRQIKIERYSQNGHVLIDQTVTFR